MGAVSGDGKDNYYSAQGSRSFSRVLKSVAGVVVLVFFFSYATRMFAGSSTESDEAQFWRVDSLTQTDLVVNAQRHTPRENETLPQAETDKQSVIQGTGPGTDNISGLVDEHYDSSISSSVQGSERIQTLFSTLPLTYTDIKLGKDNGIPTVQFLDVSEALKPLLDAVGSSVSLIEGDIGGNAEKLRMCYDENPSQCQTIQDMLTYDIKMGRAGEDSRSVVALTWFKRAFLFIKKLMVYIANGAETYDATLAAYEEVLSKHHTFFVRLSFKAAMNLLPYRKDLLKKLVVNKTDLARPGWEAQVSADMKQYFLGMESILSILRDFFTVNNLEN